MSARTLVALVTPGSCFAGTLAELALAADRTLMLDDDETVLQLTDVNDGWYPMANGISRLATRFWGHDDTLAHVRSLLGKQLSAGEAFDAGLVTSAPDDLDWDDEVRILLEERASFSPDALTAWRRTSGSPDLRRWRRRSSPASRRGRTGSSNGRTRSAPTAPSSAMGPVFVRHSTGERVG